MIVSSIQSNNYQKDKYVPNDKINITFFGLLSFVCGLLILYPLNLMGELFGTEVILPVFTIILMISGKEKRIFQEKVFWLFVISTLVMIMGYIISDLLAGTSQHNYLRAWGRNAVLFSDIVCLSIMAATDKRFLWWYIFGVAVGSIMYLQSTNVPFSNAYWKLAYSQPILMLVLVTGYFVPNIVTILLTLAVGIFSFFMDSRSFSTMCILLAGILWIRQGNTETLTISKKSVAKILFACTFAISIIILVMSLTDEDFGNRRDTSSLGRTTALRIGLIAISDSPIIGYGSWGEGTKKYADMLFKETRIELRQLGQSNYQRGNTFMAHSQILQSWMEGGIFAAQLFIFYGYKTLASLKIIILKRRFDYMTPFYCFFLISAFWGLFMSPYAGSHRLSIALAIAVICAIHVESTIENRKSGVDSKMMFNNSF